VSGEPGTRRTGDHGLFDEMAVGWALHALEPEDEARFALHLPDCARCARTVAETSEVMAALAADLPPAEPSAALQDRLRAAVDRTEQLRFPGLDGSPDLADLDDLDEAVGEVAPPRRPTGFQDYEHRRPGGTPARPPWRRLLPSALVAAAVATMLGLGTWNVMLSDARTRAETAAAQQSQIVHALLRPGPATVVSLSDRGGHPLATVVARAGQVQVVTNGLAVNDATRDVYVVWGMTGNTPVALGTFDVVRAQMDLRTLSSDGTRLDDYPAYAVSLEHGRQAPRTPSAVIAQGEVTS
jgi:anti-sigma-K factor RskA